MFRRLHAFYSQLLAVFDIYIYIYIERERERENGIIDLRTAVI